MNLFHKHKWKIIDKQYITSDSVIDMINTYSNKIVPLNEEIKQMLKNKNITKEEILEAIKLDLPKTGVYILKQCEICGETKDQVRHFDPVKNFISEI